MKILSIYLVAILVLLGLGYFLFQKSNEPPKDLPGMAYEIQGAGHMPACIAGEPPYNSNPPTSGCHDATPADWGVYEHTPSDQALIHSLEHGGIWISHKPGLASDQLNGLKDFTQRYRKVVVAPREANDANISVAAWGRLLKLESYDERAILEFIDAFYDKVPEKAG